jgi:hypothetical protein
MGSSRRWNGQPFGFKDQRLEIIRKIGSADKAVAEESKDAGKRRESSRSRVR